MDAGYKPFKTDKVVYTLHGRLVFKTDFLFRGGGYTSLSAHPAYSLA